MILLKVKVNNPSHKFKITMKAICIPIKQEMQAGALLQGTLSNIIRPYLKKKIPV